MCTKVFEHLVKRNTSCRLIVSHLNRRYYNHINPLSSTRNLCDNRVDEGGCGNPIPPTNFLGPSYIQPMKRSKTILEAFHLMAEKSGSKFHSISDDSETCSPDDQKIEIVPRKGEVVQLSLPIGSDEILRERYLNPYYDVRLGKILEDLDCMAAFTAYCHCMDIDDPGARYPHILVTAFVDHISVLNPHIFPDQDIIFKGKVTWVGTSSMEIALTLCQADKTGGELTDKLYAYFMFMARNRYENSKEQINPLILETEEDKKIFCQASERVKKRKKRKDTSLLKVPPTNEEYKMIHDIFLETVDPSSVSYKGRICPPGSQWMTDTWLKNVIICQPENKNMHMKIFGGFLMRQAYELAWINVLQYTNISPILVAVNNIEFHKPVPIGSVLLLSSKLVYNEGNMVHARVHARIAEGSSNVFHFTFSVDGEVPRLIPQTYAEHMLYLDGKRHFDLHKNI